MTYKELHRELWLWLADNPEMLKSDWPRWKHNGGDIGFVTSYCFACEYIESMYQLGFDVGCHKYCPIGSCQPEYDKWWRLQEYQRQRRKWALRIANKEWTDYVDESK